MRSRWSGPACVMAGRELADGPCHFQGAQRHRCGYGRITTIARMARRSLGRHRSLRGANIRTRPAVGVTS